VVTPSSLVIERSAFGTALRSTLLESLLVTGSVSSPVFVAVLVRPPDCVTVATMVSVVVAFFGRAPMFHRPVPEL
jgi:hypothetical protein